MASIPDGYYDPDSFPDVVINLISLNGTFQNKRIAVPDGKSVVFGRLPQDAADVPTVPRFQSKVVSRQHCIISNVGGKYLVKDAGSSSGTFLQNPRLGDKPYRLSDQAKESATFELHDGDMVQLGEDYDQGEAFHKCIQIRVNFPSGGSTSQYASSPKDVADPGDGLEGSSFIDYSTDPNVRREVEDEFNALWASLTSPLANITPRGNSFNQAQRKTSEPPQRKGTGDSSDHRTPPPTPHPAPVGAHQPALHGHPVVDGVNPNECVNFIQSLNWESPQVKEKLVELVRSGDTHLLGFYRSLKQFPSAFKDVVTKYLQKKGIV